VIFLCALFNNVIASPYYLGIQYGINFVQSDTHISQVADPGAEIKTTYKTGTIAALKFGRSIFHYLELDGSVAKRTNRVGPSTVGGAQSPRVGDWTVMSYMVNLSLKSPSLKKIMPYVGFGIGASNVNADITAKSGNLFIDDNQTKFSWQGQAGVVFSIYSKVAVYFEYQYLHVNDTFFTNASSLFKRPYRANSISVGVKLLF
jgi:opacity protein-like surface antigen